MTLLLSMGYDSLAAWVALGRPEAVYYNLGSVYSAPEMRRYEALRARYPEAPLRPIDHSLAWLGQYEAGPTAFVPLRNFLLVATAWAQGADTVVLAAATDYGPDKRLAFTLSLELAARVAMGPTQGRHLQGRRGRPRVVRPFRWHTKARLLQRARAAHGSWDGWLDLAYSCYTGTEPGCGLCRACRASAIALAAAGAPSPLPRGQSFRALVRHMPLHFGAVAEWLYAPLKLHMTWLAYRATRGH